MKNALISVIVPVYNVEKYINKCIESLANQTIENIEIILVDDGSTDSSGAICDEYENKYDNIKVIHKKNGGLSSARNVGIDNAKGEYLAFVDSDDWVDHNTYEHLYHLIKSGEYGFASFGFLEEFGTETEQSITDIKHKIYNQKELFSQILNDNSVAGYACNKLLKRCVVGDERFDETLLSCEDIDFCVRIASKCKKVIHTESMFYHYRQRNDSMTGDFSYNVRKLSVIKAYENIMPIYKEYDFEDYYKLERNYLKIALNIKGRMILSKVKDDKITDRLESIIREYYPKVLKNSNNSFKVKANIIFTNLFPGLLLKAKQYVLKKRRGLND